MNWLQRYDPADRKRRKNADLNDYAGIGGKVDDFRNQPDNRHEKFPKKKHSIQTNLHDRENSLRFAHDGAAGTRGGAAALNDNRGSLRGKEQKFIILPSTATTFGKFNMKRTIQSQGILIHGASDHRKSPDQDETPGAAGEHFE